MCPIIDSSEASQHYDDLTEEEHIICEASAGLEDFVLQFFDRLHTWIDMNAIEFTRHEQVTQDQNKKTRLEYSIEHVISATIAHILPQLSPKIFAAAWRKMYNFATEHVFEVKVSGKLVALLCCCFVRVNPKETLRVLLPYLCDTVERMIEENEGILKEERPHDEFLYNLQILAEVRTKRFLQSKLSLYSKFFMIDCRCARRIYTLHGSFNPNIKPNITHDFDCWK